MFAERDGRGTFLAVPARSQIRQVGRPTATPRSDAATVRRGITRSYEPAPVMRATTQ
jgi:hypothetical protein